VTVHSFVHPLASFLLSLANPVSFPIGNDHFGMVSRSEVSAPLTVYFLRRACVPRPLVSSMASIADFPSLMVWVRWSFTSAEVPADESANVTMKDCGSCLVPKFLNFHRFGEVRVRLRIGAAVFELKLSVRVNGHWPSTETLNLEHRKVCSCGGSVLKAALVFSVG
jgi:hypothetical protein